MIFLQPGSLPELAQCLAQKTGPESFLVAGCTDFLAQRNGRPWDARLLISLANLPQLREIRQEGRLLVVGAMCTHTSVEESPLVRRYFPALALACGSVGSKQVRNRGTVGGSIGNASPAGDLYPVLMALGAQAIVMNSSSQMRPLPMDEVILGVGKTALAEDEAIVLFQIPLPPPGTLNAFVKLGERKQVTIAKINLAVSCLLDGGVIHSPKAVLGAVGEKAFFSAHAAAALDGKPLSRDLVPAFGLALAQEVRRSIPTRASMPYKSQAVLGLADDMLSALLRQA